MVNNNGNNNGFTTPSRVSWGAVSAILLAVAQFIAVIVWAAGEHGARLALENRFNEYRMVQDVKQRDQDATVNRIDEGGTRVGQLVAERQLNVIRRIDIIEQRQRQYEEMLRRTSRENFKPEDFRPSQQWPQP